MYPPPPINQEVLGKFWGGFWEVSGRFWEVFGRFLGGKNLGKKKVLNEKYIQKPYVLLFSYYVYFVCYLLFFKINPLSLPRRSLGRWAFHSLFATCSLLVTAFEARLVSGGTLYRKIVESSKR